MHPDGYVELRDRAKDIIISGGENVSTIEVEQVLLRHPDVLEAAVTAMPSEKWGERPIAFVTLRDGGQVTEPELIAFARESLPGFKAPDAVALRPAAEDVDRQGQEVRAARACSCRCDRGVVSPLSHRVGAAATPGSGRGSPGTSRPDRPST